MIDGLVAGKFIGFAEERRGKGDTLFVVAKVLASTTTEHDTLIVNVIAFDAKAMEALLVLREGDAVSIAGHLTPKVWTDKQGNTRPALDMVAQRVLSLHPLQ